MASNSSSGVVRRRGSLYLRYNPYARSKNKEEVVRLGVKLSVSLAESMFLLCDDIRTMLCFCLKLLRVAEDLRKTNNPDCPVVERLLSAMHYVYCKDIKPNKKTVFQSGGMSVQWGLITTTYTDFADAIILLHRLFFSLANPSSCSFDHLQLKQLLNKLEGKLKSAEDVSKANGFSRETVESSLYNIQESTTPKVIKDTIITDLFQPFLDELSTKAPQVSLKEEVVRLGVELSLYMAQSMFVLCDDTHAMLRFCFLLWRVAVRYNWDHDSPVADRLLLVIHYVYSKPKNGLLYQTRRDGLVRWLLITSTWEDFSIGIRALDDLVVLIIRGQGHCLNSREFTSAIELALKKIEEKLRRAKALSEFNGFAREAMESNILDLWQSVFDKEAKEATQTLKVIKNRILTDLWNQFAPPPP